MRHVPWYSAALFGLTSLFVATGLAGGILRGGTPAPASNSDQTRYPVLFRDGLGLQPFTVLELHERQVEAEARWEQARQAEEARRAAEMKAQQAKALSSQQQVKAPLTSSCQYADLIRAHWPRDAEWAISIAWRESRCRPDAYNPSGASGLFQLLGHQDLVEAVCPGGSVFDPVCNVKAAWALYSGSGRSPWSL